jgi:hypothetical protein
MHRSLERANTQLQGATSLEVRVMEFGSYPMAVLHWIATPCPAPSNPSQRSLGFSSLGETWTGLINTSVGRTILDPLQLDCGSIRKVSATGGGRWATKGAQALGTTSLWN